MTESAEDRLLLGLAGTVAGRRVLDVGCGDGALAVSLWKQGASVAGIDTSLPMIETAKMRAQSSGADIALCVGEAERLPFRPAQFDVVFAKTVLCFVDDAGPVFQELARLIRPGGLLIIGELGRWSPWAIERRIRSWLGSRLWRKGRFRTASGLRTLAENAGLDVNVVRGAVYYPRWRLAARFLATHDQWLGRMTTFGAAFLALAATKPQ